MKPSNGASYGASRLAAWGVFWGEAELKPHLMRYWLNNERGQPNRRSSTRRLAEFASTTPKPRLAPRGRSSALNRREDGHAGLGAAAPALLLRPGKIERQEFEYARHGTQCLIANFEVATGQVIAPTIGPTRTEADFATHVAQTIATDPEAAWIFVVDQLNMHQSEALVRLVAKDMLTSTWG